MFLRPVLISAALILGTAAAHADILNGSYSFTVHEGVSNGTSTPGQSFDTANPNPYNGANTAVATFTYNGALSFNNSAANNGPSLTGDLNSTFFALGAGRSITGYSGSGTVNYPGIGNVADYTTLASFLASSGSASTFAYGSYYEINLGNLLAGTVLTIMHDDGISVFQGGTRIGSSVSGPTSVVTDTITVANAGLTTLRYARENGTPSVLSVNATGGTAVTPEPSSLALLGTAVLGMAGVVRRRLAA